MIFDLSNPVLSLDGEPIKDGNTDKLLTVSSLVINALMTTYKDDAECKGEEKLKRFNISESAMKNASQVELTSTDVAFILKYVEKAGFSPLAYKRIYEILEKKE